MLDTADAQRVPPVAEQATLAGNPSVNTIFTSEATLPGGAPFVNVSSSSRVFATAR